MTASTTLLADLTPEILDRHKQAAAVAQDQWFVLAGIRFVLAFIVMASHILIVVGFVNPIYWIANAFEAQSAVAAFFVISGYSIASSLKRDPVNFYARRFWRIYPNYVVAFAMSILPFVFWGYAVKLPLAVFTLPGVWKTLGTLLFLNIIWTPVLEINIPIWTIGTEVIFYAFAPLFERCRAILIAALIAASAIIYGSGWVPFGVGHCDYEKWGFAAVAWLCFWLLGFELYRSRGAWRWITMLLPVALICLHHGNGVLAPFTIATAMLLLVNAQNIAIASERVRVTLNYLGDLSYPLYLIHYPMMVWVWESFHTKNVFVYIIIALAAAAAVLAAVDKPLRGAWKKISDWRMIGTVVLVVLGVAYAGLSVLARIQNERLHQFYLTVQMGIKGGQAR